MFGIPTRLPGKQRQYKPSPLRHERKLACPDKSSSRKPSPPTLAAHPAATVSAPATPTANVEVGSDDSSDNDLDDDELARALARTRGCGRVGRYDLIPDDVARPAKYAKAPVQSADIDGAAAQKSDTLPKSPTLRPSPSPTSDAGELYACNFELPPPFVSADRPQSPIGLTDFEAYGMLLSNGKLPLFLRRAKARDDEDDATD